jgi:hypothetical protein
MERIPENNLASAVLRQAVMDVCVCMNSRNFNQSKRMLLYNTLRWIYGDDEWFDFWCEKSFVDKKEYRKLITSLLHDKSKRKLCLRLLGINKVTSPQPS